MRTGCAAIEQDEQAWAQHTDECHCVLLAGRQGHQQVLGSTRHQNGRNAPELVTLPLRKLAHVKRNPILNCVRASIVIHLTDDESADYQRSSSLPFIARSIERIVLFPCSERPRRQGVRRENNSILRNLGYGRASREPDLG